MDTAARIVIFTAIVLASQVSWWTLTTEKETEQRAFRLVNAAKSIA